MISLAVILIRDSNDQDKTVEEPIQESETPEIVDQTENTDNSSRGYSEIVIENTNTGLKLKELNNYEMFLTEDTADCDLDERIALFYSDDDDFDAETRVYKGVTVVNKEVVGEDSFLEYQKKYQDYISSEHTKTEVFKLYCYGGAAHETVSIPNSFRLNEQSDLEELYLGGYQYVPNMSEPVSVSYSFYLKDENNNLVRASFIYHDPEILKFEDLDNIEGCIALDQQTGQKSGDIDIKCAAKILQEDSESLDKILEALKDEASELIQFD